jgi:hypothetical protein
LGKECLYEARLAQFERDCRAFVREAAIIQAVEGFEGLAT